MQNDNATLVIGSGNFFTAPVGTVLPTDLGAIPSTTWEAIGHTALDQIFQQDSSGGDVTILGTLQSKTLRSSRTAKVDSFTIKLQQFDTPSLKLYYGANAVENADGTVGVPQSATPTVVAFLAVFVDADSIFAVYAPKAEIIGSDAVDFANTDALSGLPLKVTPVTYQTNGWAYAVTPIGDPAAG